MKSCLYFFPPVILVRTNKRYDVSFQILPYVARPSSLQQRLSLSVCGQSCAAGSSSSLRLPSAPAVISLSPRCCPCSPCAGWQQPKEQGDWSLMLQGSGPLCCSSVCRWFAKREINQLCLMQSKYSRSYQPFFAMYGEFCFFFFFFSLCSFTGFLRYMNYHGSEFLKQSVL